MHKSSERSDDGCAWNEDAPTVVSCAFFRLSEPVVIFNRRLFCVPPYRSDGKDTKMIIKYKFVTGEVTEVEVSEEIGAVITASRRDEHALEERNRYHCYSFDAIEYEGKEYADPDTPESIHERTERDKRLYAALETLTEVQRRRLLMRAEGLSYREIARREGVSDHKKIQKSINEAREKIKKFF